MLKKEEVANPDSCLNRAKDDEPIFPLLGRDACSAFAIRMWALERVKTGKNRDSDPEIIEAYAAARTMEAYAKALKSALNPAAAWPFPAAKA